MSMYLIQNTKTKAYIKKQDTQTLDSTKLATDSKIMESQIYESEREAEINAKMLNQALNTNDWTVVQPFGNYQAEADYFENKASVKEYLKWYRYDINRYRHPSVTVDLIALRMNPTNYHLQILLVKRKYWPYKDMWALPGSFVNYEESINDVVIRETKAKVGADLTDETIIRLPAVSKAKRDIRSWVITNPNIVLFKENSKIKINSDSKWFDVSLDQNELALDCRLAFDHKDIIKHALMNLKSDFAGKSLPRITSLIDKKFTLNELKTLYSQIDDRFRTINNTNLYRLYKTDLIQTNKYKKGDVGRPDRIYGVKN